MEKAMTPSTMTEMTDAQIDKAVETVSAKFRKVLRKRRRELPSEAVQVVLGQGDLGDALFAPFQARVKAVSQTFVEEVNYGDQQWGRIEERRYVHIDDVTAADYPEQESGKKLVRFRELDFNHDPTDDEVLAKAAALGCRQPSRAEVETFIRKRYTSAQLAQHPRIGLIGPAKERYGYLRRACVVGYERGVKLISCYVKSGWDQHSRFVVCE